MNSLKQLNLSLLITRREYDQKVDQLERKIAEMQSSGQQITFEAIMSDLGLNIQSPNQTSGKDAAALKQFGFGESRRADALSNSVEQIS